MTYPSPVSVTHSDSYSTHNPIFRPPESPATASASPHCSTTASDYFTSKSRKRQRSDSTRQQISRTVTPSWNHGATPSDAIFGSNLVNERYRLAGGFDTPSIKAATHTSSWDETTARARVRDDHPAICHDVQTPIFGPLARERNGAARVAPAASPSSWTNFAFGLVGKVFSFGGNVIRGFYAGSGQGYAMNNDGVKRMTPRQTPRASGTSTPIPGAWNDDDFLGDFEQDNHLASTPTTERPPTKRRQTDKEAWIVVTTPDLEPTASSRATAKRPSLANTSRASASRASSRRSFAPVPRRQSSYLTSQGLPSQSPMHFPSNVANIASDVHMDSSTKRASLAPTRSSPLGHARRQSWNNPAYTESSTPLGTPNGTSYTKSYGMMSPEAERFARKQARQDRQTDRAMATMGKKMEEMIRQAQEALGMKVEIVGDVGGEFWDDDDGVWG